MQKGNKEKKPQLQTIDQQRLDLMLQNFVIQFSPPLSKTKSRLLSCPIISPVKCKKKTIFRHRLSARNSVPVEKSHNIFSSLAVYHLCLTESLICLTKIRKMYFNVFFFSYFNYALFIKLFIIWFGKQHFLFSIEYLFIRCHNAMSTVSTA